MYRSTIIRNFSVLGVSNYNRVNMEYIKWGTRHPTKMTGIENYSILKRFSKNLLKKRYIFVFVTFHNFPQWRYT